MRSPDGKQMYFTGSYTEVVPMKRLVFTDSFSDAEGNVMSHGMMGEGMPSTTMDVTVTFVHAAGKTTVTVSHVGAEHAAMGWEQAFNKLAAVLAKG
jgi:uncharacterized protein YndB with AHSA1/START domain